MRTNAKPFPLPRVVIVAVFKGLHVLELSGDSSRDSSRVQRAPCRLSGRLSFTPMASWRARRRAGTADDDGDDAEVEEVERAGGGCR